MAELSLTRDEVRAFDRHAIEEIGVPGAVLMENAGRGAAEILIALGIHGRVLICCGKGNNGGDGLVSARHLHLRGVPLKVLLFARPEELTGDAAINYGIAARSKLPLEAMPAEAVDFDKLRLELRTSEWAVDALFGTGLSGPVRSPFDRIVAEINDSPVKVMAVDIPSGLDCDSGRPLGAAIRAQHTVTFVALKRGFTLEESRPWTGKVHVAHIGMPWSHLRGSGKLTTSPVAAER